MRIETDHQEVDELVTRLDRSSPDDPAHRDLMEHTFAVLDHDVRTEEDELLPVRAPRANAIAERFVGSIRRELLDRTLIINQWHAAAVLGEYEHPYNSHRPHRVLGQAAPLRPLPQPTTSDPNTVRRRDRLGGLLHEYQQVV